MASWLPKKALGKILQFYIKNKKELYIYIQYTYIINNFRKKKKFHQGFYVPLGNEEIQVEEISK